MSQYTSAICSDEELLEELRKLGYEDVSSEIFNMMKDDLTEIAEKEQKNSPTLEQGVYSVSSDLLSVSGREKSPDRCISRKTKKKSKNGISSSSKVCEDKLSLSEVSGLDDPVCRRKTKNASNVLSEQGNTANEDTYLNSVMSPYKFNDTHKLKSNASFTKTKNAGLDINKNDDSKHSTGSILLSKGSYFQSDYSSISDRLSPNLIPTNKHKTKTSKDKFSSNFDNNNEQSILPSVQYTLDNSDKSSSNLNSSQSFTNSEIKTMKRKVLRRRNGQSIITEEILQIPSVFDTSYPESENFTNSKSLSSDDLSPKSNSSTGSVSIVSSESSLKTSPSTLSLVSTRSSFRVSNSRKKKSDPVAMYGYYRKFWDNFKPPGEKTHDKLRWAVRDRMLEYNF